jgi:hypothetical protein
MGLDIYLYRYNNFNDSRSREVEYENYSNNLWKKFGGYSSLSQEKKDEILEKTKEFALSLGLNEWGEDITNREKIMENHPVYSDHYFKIGYFESSYNYSGIEYVLSNLNVSSMKDIFNYDGESYVKPNWEESLERCEIAIHQLRSKGPYRIKPVSGRIFTETIVKSSKDAMDVFLDEINQNKKREYKNANGEFFSGDPLKVIAMIPGKTKILKEIDCIYVVTESDNSWYVQALEIIRDTIKYVLSKENKEQYYLHWSA